MIFGPAQSSVGRAASIPFLLSSAAPSPRRDPPQSRAPGCHFSTASCLPVPSGNALCPRLPAFPARQFSAARRERATCSPYATGMESLHQRAELVSLLLLPGWRLPCSSLCPPQGTFHSDQAGDTMLDQVMAHVMPTGIGFIQVSSPAQESS